MKQYQHYQIDFPTSSKNDRLVIGNCGITFINKGNTPIILNNSLPLNPGDVLEILANENEFDDTQYYWIFPPNTIPAPQNLLVMVRKTYV
jgi:hypothetical protein